MVHLEGPSDAVRRRHLNPQFDKAENCSLVRHLYVAAMLSELHPDCSPRLGMAMASPELPFILGVAAPRHAADHLYQQMKAAGRSSGIAN